MSSAQESKLYTPQPEHELLQRFAGQWHFEKKSAASIGNCGQMIAPPTRGQHTAHTTCDVDLIVVDDQANVGELHEDGRLADIASTAITLLGLAPPNEMTGATLLQASQLTT